MSKKRTPMSTGLVAHLAASAAEPSISSGVFSIPEDVAGGFLDAEEALASKIRSTGAFRVIRLKNGRLVRLTSVYIPSAHVEELTYIHEANIRSKSGVTEETVDDLIGSVRSGGVVMEVLAVRGADTRYGIFDGQRRRYCALLADKGLPIAYTDETEDLSMAELRELSRLANLTRPNSLYDKGLHYARVMKDEGLDVLKVASLFGVHESEVRASQWALEIPLPLYELLPDGTGTGRPTILNLRRTLKLLTKGQVEALILWAQGKEPYPSAPKALADIAAQATELAGEKPEKRTNVNVIAGIAVKQKKGNTFELTLPDEISSQQLFDLLAMLKM